MGRKCWNSFLSAMGLLAVVFTVVSLIFPDAAQVRVLYLGVCVLVPNYLFAFFTFELNLFSRYLWVRRAIVIFFGILVMIAVHVAFGYLRWEWNRFLLIFSVSMLFFVLLSVFAYYVGDKMQERNLKAINQKLADEMAKKTK